MTLAPKGVVQAPAREWQSYPEYRNSEVEWLGEIPAHWNLERLKRMSTFYGGGTPSKDHAEFWSGTIPWVSPKDMRSEMVEDSEDHVSEQAIEASATRLIAPGAVLIVVRSGILRHSIPVALNSGPVTLNQDMKAVVSDKRLTSSYLASLIRSHQSALLVEWKKSGATVESIEHELLARTRLPVPPVSEQRAITTFLDRETAKIDALIAKRERLIELLEEKRTALISQAVTKGLNPEVPMKDSEVEWLGMIPTQWEVKRLKHVAKLESGHTPSRSVPEYWQNCTIPWVSLADVGKLRAETLDIIDDTKEKVSELGLANSAARLLPPNTVILSRTASVGFSAILGQAMATTQDFVNWICGPNLRPRYLLQCFRAMKQEFERLTMGSTHQTIYMPDVERFVVPVPPLEEQIDIDQYIHAETAKIFALMGKIKEHIEKLREYRTALISAAVTGTIDVRGELDS